MSKVGYLSQRKKVGIYPSHFLSLPMAKWPSSRSPLVGELVAGLLVVGRSVGAAILAPAVSRGRGASGAGSPSLPPASAAHRHVGGLGDGGLGDAFRDHGVVWEKFSKLHAINYG